ncbi:hypothetical protein Tco_1018471 [Tanacetum coccineum]|uniref:UBN2 domain-containing protein n=1 Tax=Tanacetum coccineum TaxID=301880 RepID=A0ABQ5FUD9_9ASTR
MQRPHLLNDDFYYEVEDSETKLIKETPYELLEDDQKKKLGKNNKAYMTLIMKESSCVKLPKSLKSLDLDYSNKNHVRKFLRDLLLKWRGKVMATEEAKDLATLPLDEIVENLKVYEMILENDGVVSKTTTKDKVKSLALKPKVTRDQTSDDSDSQYGSDEDVEEEEEAEAFNLVARNFRKFFRRGNWFGRGNRFGNGGNRFNKGRESQKRTRILLEEHGAIVKTVTNIKTTQHENEELLRFNEDFTKTFEKLLKEKRTLKDKNSKLSSKINDLEMEVKKLANDKEVIEPCKKCEVLIKEVDSLECNVSKLQDEALNFLKFKESSIALDDMLSRQKLSQDKEGLGFSKNDKITSTSPNKPIVFLKESQNGNSSKRFVKPIAPQTRFANSRGS